MPKKTDPTFDAPVTHTGVRDFSRVKQTSSKAFSVVNPETKQELARVVPKDAKPTYDGSGALVSVAPASMTIYRRLSSKQGYPRGYNPQQMSHIRAAEESGRLQIRSTSSTEPETRTEDNFGPERAHPALEEHLTREALARSNHNIFTSATPENPLNITLQRQESIPTGARGIYFHDKDQNGRHNIFIGATYKSRNPQMTVEAKAREHFHDYTGTILHEIGHHVDVTKRGDNLKPRTLYNQARAEAFADVFSSKTAVGDPRAVDKDRLRAYPGYARILAHSVNPHAKSWSEGYVASGGKMGPDKDTRYANFPLEALPFYKDRLEGKSPETIAAAREHPHFIHPVTGETVTYNQLIDHLSGNEQNNTDNS
jgi:hypothetical protein